jgi:hypothetical protein
VIPATLASYEIFVYRQYRKSHYRLHVILSGPTPELCYGVTPAKNLLLQRDPSLDFRRNVLHGADPLRVTIASFAVVRL